jgi:predicted permease
MDLFQSLFVILIIISLGLACQKNKIFTVTQIEGFELFLFKIAIPCYLFTATSYYELSTLLHNSYMFSYLLSFLVIAIIIILYSWRSHSPSKICINVLTSGYVNAAIYTLPVITFLLRDPKAAILSNLIQVIAIQPVLLTILSVFSNEEKSILTRLLASISSPLVIMSLISLLLNYCQLTPPLIIMNVIKKSRHRSFQHGFTYIWHELKYDPN